jgi:hypothetical protein
MRLNPIVLIALILSLPVAGVHAIPLPQNKQTVTIPIDGPAATVRCEYLAALRGGQPSSGVMEWGHVADRPGRVVINTNSRQPVTRLSLALVYCPGFAFSVLRDQPITDPVVKLPPIRPIRLPTVKLKGRVLLASLGSFADGIVEVLHDADWIVELYGAWDGVIPKFGMGSVPLGADGTFTMELPDWSRDGWVSRFRSWGLFQFTATIRGTRYGLQPPAEFGDKSGFSQGLIWPPGSPDLNVTFTAKPTR